ncbi:MAG: GTPase [Cyanobacteria bacterium J06600_6]
MRQYLLVGRTGVGKSSFINSVFGRHIAKISRYEACTKMVDYYAYKTMFGDIKLIDTPGLAEDDEECDLNYLRLIRENIELDRIHTTLYVSRLDETRFRADEKRTLKLLTESLGTSIWKNAILVFTFAASISEDKRKEVAYIRASHIQDFLRDLEMSDFDKFNFYCLVDNMAKNWSKNGVSIDNVFNKSSDI